MEGFGKPPTIQDMLHFSSLAHRFIDALSVDIASKMERNEKEVELLMISL